MCVDVRLKHAITCHLGGIFFGAGHSLQCLKRFLRNDTLWEARLVLDLARQISFDL
jgi:hypothetical protein